MNIRAALALFLRCSAIGFSLNLEGTEDIVITTRLGLIRGKTTFNNYGLGNTHGNSIDVFLGVPFARPPINELRFEKPVSVTLWNGVLDGTKPPPACPQAGKAAQSEDCLYMNIYTPHRTTGSTTSYPVMVYIHGGSLMYGSANDYKGDALASKNVIVITLNYRLSTLGYLSSGDQHLPGNYGFLDQVAALRWVQDNIADFGGRPDMVTVFGCSAGAAQIGLHIVSPLSRGLFHRAIMQSGAINAHWAKPSDSTYFPDLFRLVAKRVGCHYSTNVEGAVKCLKKVPYRQLIDRYDAPDMTHFTFRNMDLRPFVDGDVLDRPLDQMLAEGRINPNISVIIGVTEHESLIMFYTALKTSIERGMNRSTFSENLKHVFHQMKLSPTLLEAVSFQYTNWSDPYNEHMYSHQLIQAVTDMEFLVPSVVLATKLHRLGFPVYFYRFGYSLAHEYGTDERYYDTKSYHGLELPFVFGYPFSGALSPDVWHEGNYSDADRRFSNGIMDLWTSFARSGVPQANINVTWREYCSKSSDYLLIDSKFSMRSHLKPEEVEFWTNYVPALIWMSSTSEVKTFNTEMWLFVGTSLLLAFMVSVLLYVHCNGKRGSSPKHVRSRAGKRKNKAGQLILTYQDSNASQMSRVSC